MLDKTFYDPNFTVPLNKYRAELGLPSVNRIFRSWIHEADCVVGLFPDWFGEPQSDWPDNVTLADFPLYDHGNRISLSPSLDEFISDGQPPVAFSAGTATATAHEFFKTSVEASEAAGLRAILLTHFRQQVPASLPKNAIHVDYAPLVACCQSLPHSSITAASAPPAKRYVLVFHNSFGLSLMTSLIIQPTQCALAWHKKYCQSTMSHMLLQVRLTS
ncbi:MAG: hypothetical protein M5R42_19155 [Rhodocyclaceae bacterium]|nr:hypothetical protein [Rhodocyclaceae bacterium]